MNPAGPTTITPPAGGGMVVPTLQTGAGIASRLLRRIHMYAGLFLAPWMLMYALSTLVMTHRETVLSFYPSRTPAMITERELNYSRSFPATATREDIGK